MVFAFWSSSQITNGNFFQICMTQTCLSYGTCVKAVGVGNGWIACILPGRRMQRIYLQDVLYVLQLDWGILSVQRMTKYGNIVLFNGIHCDVYHNPQIVARVLSKENIFELDTSSTLEEQVGAAVQRHFISGIVHLRLGHRDLAATKHTTNEILQQALHFLPLQ